MGAETSAGDPPAAEPPPAPAGPAPTVPAPRPGIGAAALATRHLHFAKALQRLLLFSTAGAFFFALARNLPTHAKEFSWTPQWDYTLDSWDTHHRGSDDARRNQTAGHGRFGGPSALSAPAVGGLGCVPSFAPQRRR